MGWRLLIERIQELQREIAQISAGNHAYFACRRPDPSKKLLHDMATFFSGQLLLDLLQRGVSREGALQGE